jgi:quinoprotein dehydrogenase-associated probable ABC transporter substrate-binding protein
LPGLWCATLILLPMLAWSAPPAGEAVKAPGRTALKICADPHSLPSSNQEKQGYENRIAALFAKDLGLPVQYTWFPQRLGFIRNTLKSTDTADKSFKCDLVMGVVDNFELAAVTRPYYRSGWAMVYPKGQGLDGLHSLADLAALPPAARAKLRIGAFDQSPIMMWLHHHNLMEQVRPYPIMTGDARAYPGQIIEEELAKGNINLTFVWGPIAGYFAKQVKSPQMVVVPLHSEPGIKLEYGIAMAVRFGEKAWKEQINGLVHKHADTIRRILVEYGVPLLEAPALASAAQPEKSVATVQSAKHL